VEIFSGQNYASSRIKFAAEKDVQGVDRERQFSESLRRGFVEAAPFEPAPHALEAEAQGELLICVTEFSQESADFLRALAGGANGLERLVGFRFTGGDALEKRALELPAALGAVRINPAPVVRAESGAGLGSLGETLFSAVSDLQRQAQGDELVGVICGLQFDILEENAIAAKATGQTEVAGVGGGCCHQSVLKPLGDGASQVEQVLLEHGAGGAKREGHGRLLVSLQVTVDLLPFAMFRPDFFAAGTNQAQFAAGRVLRPAGGG